MAGSHGRMRHAMATMAVAMVVPTTVLTAGTDQAAADLAPTIRLEDPNLAEASGLAVSSHDPGVLFTVEDAGGEPVVFALDVEGRTRAVVTVPGVENLDWEDVAVAPAEDGGPALWIADTGDAYFSQTEPDEPSRTEFTVIRIAEPVVEVGADSAPDQIMASNVVLYPIAYPDDRGHNAEAVLVLQTGIYLIDKSKELTTVWSAPFPLYTDQPNLVQPVATLDMHDVTGATLSASGLTLAIRNYTDAYVWHLRADGIEATLAQPGTWVPLPSQRQGEGLAFAPDGTSLLLSSEGVHSRVLQVRLPVAAQPRPAVTARATPSAPAVATTVTDDRTQNRQLLLGLGGLVVIIAALVFARWVRQRRRNVRTTRLASHHVDASTS